MAEDTPLRPTPEQEGISEEELSAFRATLLRMQEPLRRTQKESEDNS